MEICEFQNIIAVDRKVHLERDNFSTTFRHKQLYAALKLLSEIGTMLCNAVNSTAMPYFAHSSHVFAFDCKFF